LYLPNFIRNRSTHCSKKIVTYETATLKRSYTEEPLKHSTLTLVQCEIDFTNQNHFWVNLEIVDGQLLRHYLGRESTEIRLFLDLCDSRTIVILSQMHLAVTILIKKSIPKTARIITRTRSKVIVSWHHVLAKWTISNQAPILQLATWTNFSQ